MFDFIVEVIVVEKTLSVARNFYDKYVTDFGENMSEMKMHKLMYFVQRESLMYDNVPLFAESFLGWKYGPVLQSVREEYRKEYPFNDVDKEISKRSTELVMSILQKYGAMSPWKLSGISHNELSWKRSRMGLKSGENGSRRLEIEAIRVDAIRELLARNEIDRD